MGPPFRALRAPNASTRQRATIGPLGNGVLPATNTFVAASCVESVRVKITPKNWVQRVPVADCANLAGRRKLLAGHPLERVCAAVGPCRPGVEPANAPTIASFYQGSLPSPIRRGWESRVLLIVQQIAAPSRVPVLRRARLSPSPTSTPPARVDGSTDFTDLKKEPGKVRMSSAQPVLLCLKSVSSVKSVDDCR